jgi:SAM-dependent methyltransferase
VARFGSLRGPILEPACGSGRVTIPLLEAGCDVTGFDASAEMLDRCRARCTARGLSPRLDAARFEDFAYETRFAAILVPSSSFTLIDSFDAACAVLARFRAHLAPGGTLAFDVQPLQALGDRADGRREWTAANGDLLTLDTQHVETDWLAQRQRKWLRYERWRDNRLVATELEPWVQRFWGIDEMRLALTAAGFADIVVTGSYRAGRSPRATDPVLTFEAVAA